MAENDSDAPKEDKKTRRRRLRSAVALLRTRAGQVCGSIEQVDGLLDRVTGLVNDIREFMEGTETRELLPRKVVRRLEEGVGRMEQA